MTYLDNEFLNLIFLTGQKPHHCPLCDLKFRTQAHKNQHVQAHYRNTVKKINHKNAKALESSKLNLDENILKENEQNILSLSENIVSIRYNENFI